MSFNNVIPAWVLFPVLVKYTQRKSDGPGTYRKSKGFNTREEAEWFIHNEGDSIVDYDILDIPEDKKESS